MRKISTYALIMLLTTYNVTIFANKISVTTKNSTTQTQTALDDDSYYTENKTIIAVSPKQPTFTIKLKSNPTTGYSWFLREYNSTLITPVKHTFHAAENKLMGAPGYELWTFRVKPAGFLVPHQTSMRMVYARPWQGSESSTQLVFRVTTQGK